MRKIFIFTQLAGNAPSATLELAGEVIPSARPTYAYPHAHGNLLLKQEEIRIEGTRPQVETIECLNGGNDTLRVRIDTRILPPLASGPDSPRRPSARRGRGTDRAVRPPRPGKPPGAFRSSCGDWGFSPGRAPSWSASPQPYNDSKTANN